MTKEAIDYTKLKLGDRLPDGGKVTNIKDANAGAIGVEWDSPDVKERIIDSLKAYFEAVERDRWEPREPNLPRNPKLVYDSSSA